MKITHINYPLYHSFIETIWDVNMNHKQCVIIFKFTITQGHKIWYPLKYIPILVLFHSLLDYYYNRCDIFLKLSVDIYCRVYGRVNILFQTDYQYTYTQFISRTESTITTSTTTTTTTTTYLWSNIHECSADSYGEWLLWIWHFFLPTDFLPSLSLSFSYLGLLTELYEESFILLYGEDKRRDTLGLFQHTDLKCKWRVVIHTPYARLSGREEVVWIVIR